jgi:hypothetical protein
MLNGRHVRISAKALCAAVVLCSGCSGSRQPDPSASVPDFQKYYSTTKWYWSEDVVGLPSSVPDYKPTDSKPGAQVHLVSSDERRIIRYTEMTPRSGMKTFYGQGVLQRLDGVEAPLFGVAGKSNMFVGFFDGRLFRIEVVSWGDDPARTLKDATTLGSQVLNAHQKRGKQ